jgi:hypothetical protein
VHKDGSTTVVFQDFTTPPSRPLINTAQLQKMCRANALGYIIQIPLIEAPSASSDPVTIPPVIAALLQQYDIFLLTLHHFLLQGHTIMK